MVEWQLGPEGLKLDEAWEGLGGWSPARRLFFPYRDVAGKWTVGRGHLLTAQEIANHVFDAGMTLVQVDELFRADTGRYLAAAIQGFGDIDSCNQHWIDAGFVFSYNIGTAGFLRSGAVKLIRAGAPMADVRPHWLEWDKRWDQASQSLVQDRGLYNRRVSEFALFCAPVDAPPVPPSVLPDEQERLRMLRSSGQTIRASLRILGIEEDQWVLPGIGEGHDQDPDDVPTDPDGSSVLPTA
jgi:GH24 family phage-related lysozyme (muramidase)